MDGMDAPVLKKTGAGGRPPAARKGDVEERLLAAATRLFLTLGFEGTSCDQVALDARAGKASIYARYANKTALLKAVIDSNLRKLGDAGAAADAAGQPLRERLYAAGKAVVGNALQPDVIGLLRLIVTEAPRLQEEAPDAERIVHAIGVQHIAQAIGEGTSGAERYSVQPAAVLAATLVDQVLAPALLRALMGADLAALRTAALKELVTAIDAMMTAGDLAGWDAPVAQPGMGAR